MLLFDIAHFLNLNEILQRLLDVTSSPGRCLSSSANVREWYIPSGSLATLFQFFTLDLTTQNFYTIFEIFCFCKSLLHCFCSTYFLTFQKIKINFSKNSFYSFQASLKLLLRGGNVRGIPKICKKAWLQEFRLQFFFYFGRGGTKLGPTYQVGYYKMHNST